MTVAAAHADELVPQRRGRRPDRWMVLIVAVAVVTSGVVLGVQGVRVRHALTRERRSLADARDLEHSARRALADVRHQTSTLVADRGRAEVVDQTRARQRDAAQHLLTQIEHGLATTNQGLSGAQATLLQLARYSAQRDACLTGVQRATTALQRGSTHDAVTALGAADAPCSAALAAATGARYPYDFPDPSVLRVGSRYYAYSTNAGAGNIQVLESADLAHWSLVGDALASVPAWATPGATWAPAVVAVAGHFVAYFTVRDRGSGLECVSVAIAAAPTGPFFDWSRAPLVCQSGGSIDPTPFVDPSGALTLLWKSEAVPLAPTIIWSQPLRADGLALTGVASQLLSPGAAWEHGIVEAPSMVHMGEGDYLFYSGNSWTTAAYAEGVAVCDGPAGPCRRIDRTPVLASQGRLAGPGGASAFTTASGRVLLAFAAFTPPDVGYPNSRTLHLATVDVVDGTPVVTPQ